MSEYQNLSRTSINRGSHTLLGPQNALDSGYTRLVINKQHANTRASLAIQGKCLDSIDSTNNVFRYVPLVTLL